MAAIPFVHADMTAVLLLAAELKAIRQRLKPEMRQATSKSALAVRNRARANWKAIARPGGKSRSYPQTITMTVTQANASMVTAEIGPEKGRHMQGSFGHIFEFGTSRAPGHPHLIPAWEAEVAPYVAAMGLAAERAVLGP